MKREIWVVCEKHDGVLHSTAGELLGKARLLANSCEAVTVAVFFGANGAEETAALGADMIYVIEHDCAAYGDDGRCAEALVNLSKNDPPLVMLFPSTIFGRSVAPRVAALLETGLTADCTELAMENDGVLVQRRPAYAGHVIAEVVGVGSLPQMATVRQGVMSPPEPGPGRHAKMIRTPGLLRGASLFTILSMNEFEPRPILSKARAVLAGGLGAGKDGFDLMRKISRRTGCAIGASRAAVNAGLASYPEQVGQTGATVRPKLYIACGISGSVQHLAGMSAAEFVMAVNIDPQAPIFMHADLGYVGACGEFLELLIERCDGIQFKD